MNCRSKNFDLGALTFGLAFVAAAHGIHLALDFEERREGLWRPRAHKLIALAANCTVAINYLLGCVLVSSDTLRLYFFIAIGYWLIAGAKVVWLVNSLEEPEPSRSYAAVMDFD